MSWRSPLAHLVIASLAAASVCCTSDSVTTPSPAGTTLTDADRTQIEQLAQSIHRASIDSIAVLQSVPGGSYYGMVYYRPDTISDGYTSHAALTFMNASWPGATNLLGDSTLVRVDDWISIPGDFGTYFKLAFVDSCAVSLTVTGDIVPDTLRRILGLARRSVFCDPRAALPMPPDTTPMCDTVAIPVCEATSADWRVSSDTVYVTIGVDTDCCSGTNYSVWYHAGSLGFAGSGRWVRFYAIPDPVGREAYPPGVQASGAS